MTWAKRRQITYFTGVFIFIAVVGALFFYQTLKEVPTCFDGKRNGGEVGVDCGGGCLQYCPYELQSPKVRWSRAFEVSPGVVHAVAYIEHNNINAGVRRAPYTFKLYTEQNTLIAERRGETFIGSPGKSAIVETLIQTKNIPVAFTRFSFEEPLVWEKIDPAFALVAIKTDKTFLEPYTLGTRLTGVLRNTARFSFPDLQTIALLHDRDDNTVAVSASVVGSLSPLSEKTVIFTWPLQFDTKDIVRIELIPRINPFTALPL